MVLALAAAPAFAQPCPPGRTITNDTLGHCCWPGQVYATSRGVCVGVPTSCPATFKVKGESCEQWCPEGQKITPDTHGVCCWPGQAFSLTRRACVGVPTECPGGATPSGETCAATPGFEPEPMPTPGQPTAEGPPPPPLVDVAPPGPAPTTPPPTPAPPLKPPGPVPVVENAGPPPMPPTPPPEPPPPAPKRVRVALTTGLFTGVGIGVALGLPIRIGVYTINPSEPLQGVAAIAVEPWIFGSWRSNAGANYLGLGAGVNLAMGWEQRLGPVELFPRLGVSTVLAYQGVVSGGNANATDLLVRALVGLRFAVPSGDTTRFILGLDFYGGANSLWIVYVGVGF